MGQLTVLIPLQKLKTNESEELQVQISAYLENMYDVGQLLDDSEQKALFQQQLEVKEAELSRVSFSLCLISH